MAIAGGRPPRADWLRGPAAAARLAQSCLARRDVYFGVALQSRRLALAAARARDPRVELHRVRGGNASAVALPAAWVDLDVAGPHHRRADLPPDRDAALGLLEAVPLAPSAIVATGGGFHVYWLFRRLWQLTDEAERTAAAALVAAVQAAVRRRAAEHGWAVDPTADLARLLRLPGTVNHKSQPPRPVVLERLEPGRRYTPADFAALPEARPKSRSSAAPSAKAPDGRTPGGRTPDGRTPGGRTPGGRTPKPPADEPAADFRRVLAGCAWLRHCLHDRKTLPEPEWYAALSIVGRCATRRSDGRRLARLISRGHPGYSPARTAAKLAQALAAAGPRTCRNITGQLGAPHCRRCPHRGRVKSPIVLGGGAPADQGDGGRIRVPVSHRENEVADAALAALARRIDNLYSQAGGLVEVARQDRGRAVAHRLSEPRLRELLATACEFGVGRGDRWQPRHPPPWVVRELLARFAWPGLPVLEAIVDSPVLRPDGSVLQRPGYDRASRLVLAPRGRFEPVHA